MTREDERIDARKIDVASRFPQRSAQSYSDIAAGCHRSGLFKSRWNAVIASKLSDTAA